LVTHTRFIDVKLKLTPRQWANFVTPYGINVVWDDYDMVNNTVVGRFYVSTAHSDQELRKNEDDLKKFLDSMGRYVISLNATHRKLQKVKNDGIEWGQRTVTHEGHPYLKDVPNEIDVHLSVKDNDLKQYVSKREVEKINFTIMHNATRFPELKKFRDERFKPKAVYDSKGREKFEVYTAVLEEIQ
jgi:hypothetical protein